MKCSRCGKEMPIAYSNKNQVLYKCKSPDCGHMTLVQDSHRQNWDRDDVSKKEH